jgi:hypothetical protein
VRTDVTLPDGVGQPAGESTGTDRMRFAAETFADLIPDAGTPFDGGAWGTGSGPVIGGDYDPPSRPTAFVVEQGVIDAPAAEPQPSSLAELSDDEYFSNPRIFD